ncbi:MAG: Coenzyme F420 hydrogenase/dehydrogenase, beta subunit C-terminal domain [Defluviitaleaceae bacterium]|nr:Coenzyme F420 hydrogenase/dehydrogenase, beta subunit C-terminal domain [Defluviitaleaceae bacterium]
MPDVKDLFDNVINKNLCTLCGTCIGVCPMGVLEFNENTIKVDCNLCNKCGLCIKICPGAEFSYPFYLNEIFQQTASESTNIGNYINIYKGWASDSLIREAGSSGGAVTATLCGLLSQGEIDGAVVIGKTQTGYGVIIAKTIDEIKLAAQSKYIFIPVNEIINQLLKISGKYALVGLPCQIHGLRKAMHKMPPIKEKIKYILGIYCGFNMHKEATDYLIKKSKIPKSEIASIEYRGKHNDATGFKITSSSGKIFFLPKHNYTFLNLIFCNERCMKCYDLTAEFADISFGDAWELEKCSRIIVRTKNGENALNLIKSNFLYIENSSEEEILLKQKQLITHKKVNIAERAKLFKSFPDYKVQYPSNGFTKKMNALIFFYIYKFCSGNLGKCFINLMPIKILGWISSFSRSLLADKTVLRYFVFGVCTVLFGFLSFFFLNMYIDFRIANLISIIATKLFAYYTNKTFVFKSKTYGFLNSLYEFIRFILARGLSGLVEFFGLILLVQFAMLNENLSRALLIILTTVLNYTLGKRSVFIR